ncbi:MAG: histidine kinase N-terminal 7TM domain-containing protein [Natronomonas sp.]
MNGLLVGHVGLFVFATVGCLWGAVGANSFDDETIRRPLVVFLLLSGIWGATSVLLLLFPTSWAVQSLYIVGLVVGLSTVVAWLWFASAYTGRTYHRERRFQTPVLLLFLAIVGLKLTNPIHEAYFRSSIVAEPFVHFAPEVGVVYWLGTVIAYIGAAVGLYMLFEMYANSKFNTFKIGLLSVALCFPIAPKLVSVVYFESLFLFYYEPIGTAVFAIGVVTTARETFLTVRTPARNQLLDQLTEPVIVVDSSNHIAEYNRSAERLFPELKSNLGKPLFEAVPRVRAIEDHTGRLTLESGDEDRIYEYYTTPITLGSQTVGTAYVLSDITELERHRQQLEGQTRQMQDLTEAMAHELRNPLTIVLGRLQLLAEEAHSTDRKADSEAALEAARRIQTVVDDLISVTKYGTPITETETCSLEELLLAAWEEGNGCTLCVDVDRTVRADWTRCVQLFKHVFRAHREREATDITVVSEGDRLCIESDGEPFSVDDTERLFDYGSEAGEEVGVVLANAQLLARLHGWQITVDSDSSGLCIALSGLDSVSEGTERRRAAG